MGAPKKEKCCNACGQPLPRTGADAVVSALRIDSENPNSVTLSVVELADSLYQIMWYWSDGPLCPVGHAHPARKPKEMESRLRQLVKEAIQFKKIPDAVKEDIQAWAVEVAASEWKPEKRRTLLPWGGYCWQMRLQAMSDLKSVLVRANELLEAMVHKEYKTK